MNSKSIRKICIKGVLFVLITCLPFTVYHGLIFIFLNQGEKDKTNLKQYLLEEVPSPRIIIDSGSNSYFGIRGRKLETTFNMPCINLADEVTIPLFMRIARLRMFSRRNDIIIFPLEFIYYTRNDIPHQIFKRVQGDLKEYYQCLSVSEKIKFANLIPPATLVDYSLQKKTSTKQNKLSYSDWLKKFISSSGIINSSGDFETYVEPLEWQYPKGSNFKKWNFGTEDLSKVCEEFRKCIPEIRKLRESGRIIFFAWPVICGSPEELEKAKGYKLFFEKISNLIIDSGFSILGEPNDTMFLASEYMYNSPAHLNAKGRSIRTDNLIRNFRPHFDLLSLKNESFRSCFEFLKGRFQADLSKRILKFPQKNAFTGDLLNTLPQNASRQLLLGEGWGLWEKQQVWSIGETSTMFLRLPESNWDFARLTLRGYYHHNIKSSEIFVNNQFFGFYDFRIDQPIILIPSMIESNNILEFKFQHNSPVSPASLGNLHDRRELAFRWENLSLSLIKNAHFADCYEEVKTWYGKYLNRVPDHKGHLFWTNALVAIKTEDDRKKLEASFGREAISEVGE